MSTATASEQAAILVCRQQIQALIDQDFDKLDQLIAPDAVFEHITGVTQTRDDWLRQIKLGRMQYFNSREEGIDVTVDGSTAVVISHDQLTARIYGMRQTWALATTTILAWRQDAWVIIKTKSRLY